MVHGTATAKHPSVHSLQITAPWAGNPRSRCPHIAEGTNKLHQVSYKGTNPTVEDGPSLSLPPKAPSLDTFILEIGFQQMSLGGMTIQNIALCLSHRTWMRLRELGR